MDINAGSCNERMYSEYQTLNSCLLLIVLRPKIHHQTYSKMPTNRTFTMIKPDATTAGNTGAIIKMIEEAGFRIIAMKKTRLSSELAGKFYEIHKARPFYGELCSYMSSGSIVPMIL